MKKTTIILLLFISIFTSSKAEQFYFSQYQVENGLSNNNIETIIQDNHGFIWIGTRDGLNRFDGYTFRTFRDTDEGPNPIGNNWILSLAIDNKGTLWIGTYMGMYKYNEDEENFTLIPFSEGKVVSNLTFDSHGNLWLTLNRELVRYDLELENYHVYNIPDNGVLNSFCYTYDDNIWLVLSNGMLYKYDVSSAEFEGFDLFQHTNNYKVKDLTRIYHLPTENLLFIGTTTHGAKVFDIANSTYKDLMTNEVEETEINVWGFVQVSYNEVWFASENGLYIYDIYNESLKNIQKKQQDPYSLSTNLITAIFKDKENGIWLGTYSGGVNYYTPVQPFQKYYATTEANTLNGDIIHDITGDKYGNLWIATEDEGINKFNESSNTYTHYTIQNGEHSISHKNVHGLIAEGDNLWVGSIMGIDLINISTGKFIKNYKLGDNIAIVIMKKLSDGKMLIGTSHGMFIYNEALDRFEPLPQFPNNLRIQSILEDHEGVIWAGTFHEGLYYYNQAKGTSGELQIDSVSTINGKTFNDIYEDKANNLWFATQEGIKKYDRLTGEVTLFDVNNGMPGNITFRIVPDESDNLWITTTNGLVCLNPHIETIKVYKKEHGLITNQFNYNSSWKDESGKIYFGMVKGMVSFYPKKVSNLESKSKVYLTSMTILNETPDENTTVPISFSKEITLKHNQSTFSIDFSALSFVAPTVTKFAYYLEGLDEKWIYLDNSQTAFFTKLPYGDYTLNVKVSNLAGEWDDTPATLKINILPPWWLTNYAWAFYAILLTGIIILIINVVIKRNKIKLAQSIKQLEFKKEEELYQSKIDFFVSIAHEIRTPLTLIIGPIEKIINKELTPDVRRYASIIEKNTNRLLELVESATGFS